MLPILEIATLATYWLFQVMSRVLAGISLAYKLHFYILQDL